MILIAFTLVIVAFGFVLMFGAPYVPTLKSQQVAALKLLNLNKGQTLLELGCGDGRVLRAAAKQGIKGIGYELNPIMYVVAVLVTWRYRKLVSVRFGNFWQSSWPPADGVYVFLLDKFMEKLHKKITQELPNLVGNSESLEAYSGDEAASLSDRGISLDMSKEEKTKIRAGIVSKSSNSSSKLGKSGKNVKVVSYTFKIPQQTPIKTEAGLYLYEYSL